MENLINVLSEKELDEARYDISINGNLIVSGTMDLFTIELYDDMIELLAENSSLSIPKDYQVVDNSNGEYHLKKDGVVIRLWLDELD